MTIPPEVRSVLRHTRAAAASLVFAVVVAAAPAQAEEPKVNRIDRWRSEIAKLDGLLRKESRGATRRAGKKAEKLFLEIRLRGWREPTLKAMLAEVATQIAIAELNQGKDRAKAVWRFHSALLLDPTVGERDWGPYSRAGRILAEVEPRMEGASPPGLRALSYPFPRDRFKEPLEGPSKRVEAPLNRASRTDHQLLRPTIEVIIHADGSISHPAIQLGHSAKPTVLLAVLDMIWQMAPLQPATLDGEPVRVIYPMAIGKFEFDRWADMVTYE
ncbi:MAG: hypothetical protein AAGM22_29435 [Acidobacteriota bacterium]